MFQIFKQFENKVDKLDVDKILPVPVDLSKLSDAVKNDFVKKNVYNAKIKNIEDKMPNITNLATKTAANAKIIEVKGEILNISNLATKTALNAVENKNPSASNLVKKTDYKTKINENEKKTTHHNFDRYITAPELNELTSARSKQTNLASKSDIANFLNKTDFNNELKDVTSNKNQLNELSKKFRAISTKGFTKDSINTFSILNGAKYFLFQEYFKIT